MYNDKLTKSIAEAAKKCMDEELKGNQHKIDANKNGKIDADDFKKLRKEETVEEAMQKSDVPAYLRKQKGEKPLSVADVKGPRPDSISSKEGLAKLRNEETEELQEADIEKTSTGMRVYGSSYGNSVRARREQVKKSVDAAKGPKMKDLEAIEGEKKKKKFSEMVETYVQSGIQGLFEGWKKVKEEVVQLDELSPGTLKSYIKGAKASKHLEADAVRTAEYKGNHAWASDATQIVNKRKEGIKTAKAKLNAEEVEQIDELSLDTLKSAAKKNAEKAWDYHMDDNKYWARKSANRALNLKAKVAQKERQMKTNEEVEQVEERSLSEPEMKKREEVVKSMKKGIQGFKDRYGDRAKEVMYATATKIAKKD